MKMFKRFAAALLAGVMVLAMLTACGGGSGSGASTIGEEFENKYIAAINTLRGENAEKLAEAVATWLAEIGRNARCPTAGMVARQSVLCRFF